MRHPKPLTTFEIRATWHSRLTFTVRVFESQHDLHAYLTQTDRQPQACRAMTSTWRSVFCSPNGTWKLTPAMGEIILCQPYLGSEVLAHEATHAALAWARRTRQNLDTDEEPFAYALGYIVRQLVTALRQRHLIP